MRDPEFRKKLMVVSGSLFHNPSMVQSNNFLVELIVACCNSLFTTKVTWVQVQAEYKKMMTEETFLYSKYKQPLRLDMIRENIGPMLNANVALFLYSNSLYFRLVGSYLVVELYRRPCLPKSSAKSNGRTMRTSLFSILVAISKTAWRISVISFVTFQYVRFSL